MGSRSGSPEARVVGCRQRGAREALDGESGRALVRPADRNAQHLDGRVVDSIQRAAGLRRRSEVRLILLREAPLGQHARVQDPDDQDPAFVLAKEDDVPALFGAQGAQANIVARAPERWGVCCQTPTAFLEIESGTRLALGE